ncbi:cobaltochelatase subunit CobN [Desulfosarcina ovata]|uniref:Cobalamin biosynthesis protein CobN n=1 Tax=Desulfosarcina ovata subsp. ovata TaxID=2752305 RepID=A0A5K8A5L0_9BACT|nr:cobaltochelatase subunit CobN [Desulfosarcina ovata]BBO87893.1 cobalamin biosynthesis protein CobN [Desulfosarcina ovata subsp. ovata]
MKSIKVFCLMITFCLLFPFPIDCKENKVRLVFIISSRDTIATAKAVKKLSERPDIGEHCRFELFTDWELRTGRLHKEDIRPGDIILADFMKRETDQFLASIPGKGENEIHSLRCGYLARELEKKGIKPDIRTEAYFQPPTAENLKNLILMVLSAKGMDVAYEKPFVLPDAGIFHPDIETVFKDFAAYFDWYKKSGKYKENSFWVGIHTNRSSAVKESGKLEGQIVAPLEQNGINALPVFGKPPYHESLKSFFLDDTGHSRVDAVLGFSFRFLRGFPEETGRILSSMNAPIFIPLEAHSITIGQWKKSDTGISTLRTAWQVCIPEQNGGIEPTLVGGKTPARLKGMTEVIYDRVALPDQVAFLIKRIQAWHNLKTTPNSEKRIALLYWNHPPGKQNIGGSYMNCFKSMSEIIMELKNQGYGIKGDDFSEGTVKERILLGARNVGSWAPGELDRLIAEKSVIKLPVFQYRKWFDELPQEFKDKVIAQWGQPEASDIMIKDGNIIIPRIDLGNLIVMPQPSRGFGEDAQKLYHDPKIYPHHQYIAFYLWLKKGFQADAIISLGKHGTHEWLPGKQTGLALTDPPDVLIQDIPNIYPYIVDNVGEGIQAKRRGRGVIIDHLVPPLKKGGTYMEYRKLTALIDSFHEAEKIDPLLAKEKFKAVEEQTKALGIHKDLGFDEINDHVVEAVEHYILELSETLIPYGLHTFGVSPAGRPLEDLNQAMCEASPEIDSLEMKSRIQVCGKSEMSSLIKALAGGYIAPAEGNDPVRNPDAVPTGKNFYGFNIDKVPSKEAWAMGKKLADEMIQTYREAHDTYPEKLGLILWSTELQRNEGASVAAAFYLLGITPVWDNKDQVVDIAVIPGKMLKRPRIDVLVQSSGLFRDCYAKLIKLMDRAVRMASSMKDVENFIAVHNQKIEAALIENGYTPEQAADLSRARVFAPMPGAYSHALQELIPNSGTWEDDTEIADVFIHHYSYAYGNNIWGKPLKSGYKANLDDVKMTMHTLSSNVYNMLDNDDVFAFLGGLSLAVKHQTGSFPETVVANMKDGKSVSIEDLPKAIGKALRTRYLNPEWIKGMKQDGYSGARAMDKFVEYLWGFQVTSPWAVSNTQWEEIYHVYIQDKYGQDLKAFFDNNNPWALQSISARMLEADRKAYWKAPEEMKKEIARTFALNVIEKGVACCEHTCNNPMFQNYVTNFLSLAGLLTPKQMDQFKTTLAKASGKTLEEQIADHQQVRRNLETTVKEIQKNEDVKAATQGENIEGFEMVEEKLDRTSVASSGSAWQVMAIVFGILLLLFAGYKRITV